jgi:hypothetical protein
VVSNLGIIKNLDQDVSDFDDIRGTPGRVPMTKPRGGKRRGLYGAPQTGCPMTYMLDGHQYLVVATGGGNVSAELLAFKLPRA